MSNSEPNIVADHRNMMMFSKNLSDFQLSNLRSWPNILFDNLDSSEISYNFWNDNVFYAGQVEFNLIFKKGSKISAEDASRKLQALELWTKFLFFADTNVIIKRNGRKWTVKKHKNELTEV